MLPFDIALTFNYWQPTQENMELGLFEKQTFPNIVTEGGTTTSVSTKESYRPLKMDFDFKPGFTIGIGYKFAYDTWDLQLKYTWFHHTNRSSSTVTNFVLFNENTANISPTWGTPVEASEEMNFQFAAEKWKLGMDLVDLDVGRWCNVGSKFSLHPIFGIRAAWIRQNVHVAYTNGFTDFAVDVPGLLGAGFLAANRDVFATSRSWALGPKIAVETKWLFGPGFRFFGNGEVDLLFTQYTLLKEKTETNGTVVGIINFVPFNFPLSDVAKGKKEDVNTLRTHLALDLGFGWEKDFCKSKWSIDCAAGYTFQVFFDQNMLQHDVTDIDNVSPNGNLYIQGLTATVRFNF